MKATKSVSKAQKGWVYGVIDVDGTLGYFDPMDLPVEINGKTITLNGLINRLTEYERQHELTFQKLTSLKTHLKDYLIKAGYELPIDTFDDVLMGIERVEVINPNDRNSIAFIRDGYISQIVDIEVNQILRNQQVPSDIANGYYFVEHGKIVLDKKRKEETLSLD